MLKAIANKAFQSQKLGRRIRVGEDVVGPDSYMNELHRLGLVGSPQNKMLTDPHNKAGKSQGDGAGPPSSASPAAPASLQLTAPSPITRKRMGRKSLS
jgi:hypothetical protein